MSDDLVKRLRQFERWDPDQKEAADTIESQNEKLRSCIRAIDRLEAALRGVIAVSGRDCPEFREAVAALKEEVDV